MEFELKIDDVQRKALTQHTDKIKCMDWNKTGVYLATGGKDRTVKIWNPKHHSRCENSFPFKNTVLQVKWNPEKDDIFACTVERDNVYILTVENDEPIMSMKISGYPDHLCWSPDGNYICVMNDRGVVYIIDAKTENITTVANKSNSNIIRNDICWGFDSTCLFVAAEENDVGCIEIIQYSEETKCFSFTNSMQISMCGCTTIDIDRRHHSLVVGSNDSILTVVDYCEMIPVNSIKLHKTGIKRARWTSKGEYIAFCSSDNILTIVNPVKSEVKKNVKISDYSTIFSCNPKKNMIALVTGKSEKDIKTIEVFSI